MKIIFTLLLFFSVGLNIQAFGQYPHWAWGRQANGLGINEGNSVCTDHSGNIYVTGTFNDTTVTFGNFTLANTGIHYYDDIYLAKYDPQGNVLWAKSFGGNGEEMGNSVSVDPNGNVFIGGTFFSSSIVFGSFTLTNTHISQTFVAKLDSSGTVLWCKTSDGDADGKSISADGFGNIYLSGDMMAGTLAFGNIQLTNTNNNGLHDIFIVKYDSTGNEIWAQSDGGNGMDDVWAFSADAVGNCYVTGNFYSATASFGTTTLSNNGLGDVFIAKYDSAGTVLWAKSAGNSHEDAGYSVSADHAGNVYLTGYFTDSISFGSFNLTSNGYTDVFISKYDSIGNIIWAKSIGGDSVEVPTSISTDPWNDFYLFGGFYSDTLHFDTVAVAKPANSTYPAFIAKYDANGNALCASALLSGSDQTPCSGAISADRFGNAYIGSEILANLIVTANQLILGPDTLTEESVETVIVARYSCSCNPDPTITGDDSICFGSSTTLIASGANTFIWLPSAFPGDSISVSPAVTTTYSVVGISLTGCTDTVTMSVIVNPLPVVTLNLSAIDTQCVSATTVALIGGSPAGGIFSGTTVTGNNFSPSTAGIGTFPITYFYTDVYGCSNSAIDSIVVELCSGISDEVTATGNIQFFPNPAGHSVTLKINDASANQWDLKIYDRFGKIVFQKMIYDNQEMLTLDLASGMYFYQVSNGEKFNSSGKLIIEGE